MCIRDRVVVVVIVVVVVGAHFQARFGKRNCSGSTSTIWVIMTLIMIGIKVI